MSSNAASLGVDEVTLVPPAANEDHAKLCRREFLLMSITFGINHAAVTTPILYASTVLTNSAGQGSNAVLYGMTLVVSLFFSSLLHSWFGAKRGLTLAMFFYSLYVLLFALSSSLCDDSTADGSCEEGSSAQLPLALLAACLGGCGAGLLWTCQGAFFAHISEELAVAESTAKELVTANLSSTFATVFLSMECAIRFLTTLLTNRHFHIVLSYPVVFYILAGLAFLSTCSFQALATGMEAKQAPAAARGACTKMLAAIDLWQDPKLWLLQTTNLTFGFAAAWYGGFVNRNIVSKALNPTVIGLLGSLLSGLAALLSFLLGKVAARCGKSLILILGSCAFLCLGIGSKFIGTPADWGWGVLLFPCFQGIGRAVYESTNKAIFADFFPGPKSPGAFANVFVFGTGASTIAFILGSADEATYELYFLLAFAALTYPCYALAKLLTSR
mmetsp:Transcript_66526/g.124090  ORF Transcript_66526/g.124090 Transcript_66526/m.124090 type:complete len:444 (-) Transcript_66526:136-1467(-)